MHQLLALKLKIWIVVGLAAIAAALARLADLDPLSMGAVVGIVEFVVIQLLMRSWPLLQFMPRLLRPSWAKADLTGTWRGTIMSQWQAHPGDAPPAPIAATLDLRQGWAEVVFSLHTDKMRSRSSATTASYDPVTHELQFRYLFATVPTADSRAANPLQLLGSAVARISLDRPDSMTITYTNERGAGGDVILKRAQRAGAAHPKRRMSARRAHA